MVATCRSENPKLIHSASLRSFGLNSFNSVFFTRLFSESEFSVKVSGEFSGVLLELKKYKPETRKSADVANPNK